MDKRELPSDSDESDEDYVPSGSESVPLSEEDSDGNDEDKEEASEKETEEKGKRKRNVKQSKCKTAKKFRKKKLPTKSESKEETDEIAEEEKTLTEEEEKKKADSLWSDFMKDTGTVCKNRNQTSLTNGNSNKTPTAVNKEEKEKENKVTITKVYEFAGEEVKVTKEVPVNSAEAKTIAVTSQSTSSSLIPAAGRSRGGGGLSSVLGMIGSKKQKLGTLEKSKLDWDRFKKTEGIEEEIEIHNRGRDGYLDKQDFLQRTDLRQFELEKQLRTSRRSTR